MSAGMKSRRVGRRLFCAWPEQDSGPMVPMVVGADQLVSHLLLLGRQAGVERLERSKKTSVVVRAHFRELLA